MGISVMICIARKLLSMKLCLERARQAAAVGVAP